MGLELILTKIIGKRLTKKITILFIIIYMFITGFSTSVVRASIMAIILSGSGLLHKKADTYTSLSIGLLLTLVYNPYLILNLSLQFSYLGTIGIIFLNKNLLRLCNKINLIKR